MQPVQLITQRSNQNPTTKYNVIESDPSSFFDGEADSNSSFDAEISSEAGGLKRMIKHRRKIQNQRQKRRNLTAKSKATTRIKKANAKQTLASAQRDTAKVLGDQKDSDLAMANALSTSAVVPDAKKSNKALYWGLGIGGVIIVGGIIALVIYKRKKGKS